MSNITKSAVGLMIATLLAKILGFGREVVLGASYGLSNYSDAYIIAYNIPIIILAVIGGALSTIFIPMYSDIEREVGEKESLKFTNNVFNIVIIMCMVFAIIGFIFTEPLVKIFASGFEGEKLIIAVRFTKIIIIGTVFLGITYLMNSYLQIKGNFVIPGLVTIPQNIIIIISIILSLEYGAYILAYGTLIALISQFLFQLPFLYKLGFKYRAYLNIKDKNIKQMTVLVAPALIGIAVGQINTVIDRSLASTLQSGSISALNYANKLNAFVMAMFIVSISAVVYPHLSKLSDESDKKKFNEIIVKSLNSIILLVVPISVGAITLAQPIVKVLFERGEFDAKATATTAVALAAYSLGMIGLGIYDIISKAFYSLKDTMTPLIVGTFIGVPLNIILNLILIKPMGHTGLALATSISTLTYTFIGIIALKRKIGNFGQIRVLNTMIKSLIAAIIMGIISLVSYRYLINLIGDSLVSTIMSLSGAVLLGAIAYGVGVYLLKVEEIELIINTIKKLSKGRSKDEY